MPHFYFFPNPLYRLRTTLLPQHLINNSKFFEFFQEFYSSIW